MSCCPESYQDIDTKTLCFFTRPIFPRIIGSPVRRKAATATFKKYNPNHLCKMMLVSMLCISIIQLKLFKPGKEVLLKWSIISGILHH